MTVLLESLDLTALLEYLNLTTIMARVIVTGTADKVTTFLNTVNDARTGNDGSSSSGGAGAIAGAVVGVLICIIIITVLIIFGILWYYKRGRKIMNNLSQGRGLMWTIFFVYVCMIRQHSLDSDKPFLLIIDYGNVCIMTLYKQYHVKATANSLCTSSC